MKSRYLVWRGWFTEEEYWEGIALAQLSPGPLAAQLCFYLGYLRGGISGSALSGLAFVLPSFAMVVAIGWAYVRYGGLSWVQAVFYGVGAAVIGLISRSAHGLARKTIGKDLLFWGIFIAVAVVVLARQSLVDITTILIAVGAFGLTWLKWKVPEPLIVVAAALIGLAVRS